MKTGLDKPGITDLKKVKARPDIIALKQQIMSANSVPEIRAALKILAEKVFGA